MMKFIALLLLSGILAGSCAKPKDLEFVDIQNIRMVKFGLTESVIGLDLRLFNPNNQRVQLKDALAKVYANSTYLGDTYTEEIIAVPKKDTFSVPLFLKVPTVSAISNVVQSLKDTSVLIKVDGNIKMGKGGVFLNYPIQYEKKQSVSNLKF